MAKRKKGGGRCPAACHEPVEWMASLVRGWGRRWVVCYPLRVDERRGTPGRSRVLGLGLPRCNASSVRDASDMVWTRLAFSQAPAMVY